MKFLPNMYVPMEKSLTLQNPEDGSETGDGRERGCKCSVGWFLNE